MKKILLFFSILLIVSGCTQTNSDMIVDLTHNEQFVFLRVNYPKCRTSPLPKKEFYENCNPVSIQDISSMIQVKAFQDLENTFQQSKNEDLIEVGETVYLEFYKNGQKLDIPQQIFHTFWATDYLALRVFYKNDKDIWVYANSLAGTDSLFHFDGEKWVSVQHFILKK